MKKKKYKFTRKYSLRDKYYESKCTLIDFIVECKYIDHINFNFFIKGAFNGTWEKTCRNS